MLDERSCRIVRACALSLALGAASLVVGCGKEEETQDDVPPPPSLEERGARVEPDAGLPPLELRRPAMADSDFIESDRNRDPFRSYIATFVEQSQSTAVNQRKVLLSEYAIDELKLVAIVLRGDYPRAMLVDPVGKGWVVRRGDFIGRPEIVHVGGANGTDYQLNWRVDRIRDGDVVFSRDDPAQPGSPPATRIVPLRPDSEETTASR